MKTVAMVCQKGGTGKTTLALSLAVEAVRCGLNVVMVDLDPQVSACEWADMRCGREGAPEAPVVVDAQPARLANVAAKAREAGVDLLVIDTAGRTEQAAMAAARIADLVVVPSRFVADSLPAWAGDKARVLSPFGSPRSSSEAPAEADPSRPLRVLFVGSMGQRKGLGDLFAAMNLLKGHNIQLIVMGAMMADAAFYESQCPGYRHEKGRPHAEVLELMRRKMTTAQIARTLVVSPATVRSHVAAILRKLRVPDRDAAVRLLDNPEA